MKIAVLGTGMVGQTIASKLIEGGHEVTMGARSADNEKALAWQEKNGAAATNGTFKEAVNFSDEIVFNCTNGQHALSALKLAGEEALAGKVLLDISNPLDFSEGMPPFLSVCNKDSLGEQIQRTFPKTKVVKSLNTLTCTIMLDPARVPGDHHIFMSGNEEEAKNKVATLLQTFGWKAESILDLGDITSARGTEMLLPVWLSLYGKFKSGDFNFSVVRATS